MACCSRFWSAPPANATSSSPASADCARASKPSLHEVPARILALDDQRVFELAMVENLQREDLNAIDKASAFREYLSRYGGTQEELAGRLGVDRSTVSNLIRLLELPGEVLDAVRTSEITQGHARALLASLRSRDPDCRLSQDHHRTSLGAPDGGTRHHRCADALPTQAPQRPSAYA